MLLLNMFCFGFCLTTERVALNDVIALKYLYRFQVYMRKPMYCILQGLQRNVNILLLNNCDVIE